jgi:hypothetical protein
VATGRDDEAEAREEPTGRPKVRRRRETASGEGEREGRKPRRTRSDAERETEKRAKSRTRSLKAVDAAQMAMQQVQELTGRQPEGVTSVERSDAGWLVGVEVVEAHRIPNTTDILAVYEAELDESGELVSYRRVDRYPRGRGDER